MFIKMYLKNGFVLLLAFVLFCCKKNELDTGFLNKEAINQADTTAIWLQKRYNYNNSKKYFLVFDTYYTTKIQKQKYNDAAKILRIVSKLLSDNSDYNAPFLNKIICFDSTYSKNIAPHKTIFVSNYLANNYLDKGDFKNSETYFKKSISINPLDYQSTAAIAQAYSGLSFIYFETGQQKLSLQSNLKSLFYYKKSNDSAGMGLVNMNYSRVYRALKNRKLAYAYVNKAIHFFYKIQDTSKLYTALYNKIGIYEDFSDPKMNALMDSVFIEYNKSRFDNNALKIAIWNCRIENLIAEKKLAQAKQMIDELRPIVKKLNSTDWTDDFDGILIKYELALHPKNADLSKIINLIEPLYQKKQFRYLVWYYTVLKKYCIQNHDYKNALKFNEALIKVKDSIGTISMQDKIVEIETKYQTTQKTQQILLQDSTIESNRSTIAALILTVLSMLLAIIIYLYQQKQKKLKQRQLVAQEYTKQLLEKMEEERKRIASDLHDSVNHELLVLRNSFNTKTDLIDAKIESIMNDVRNISRNLYPILFSKIGLVASIKQMIKRLQNENDFLVISDLQYTKSLSTSNELQLYRIIQEVLSNTIKHSEALAAKITIKSLPETTFVELRDNGIGFNVPEVLTAENAFGLHNILERSKVIGGDAKITSDNQGTVVTITIKN